MAKKFDLTRELAGLLTAALAWRTDTGVYASAIAGELGLTIEDEEAAVLARLREALAAPAFRVKITVTGDCGHVLWTGFDRVDEKYPFGCSECEEDKRTGKYPWKLATEIVATGPTVIKPHDEGSSYCTSLPLHDHDRPGETCPAYRTDDNGDRWPCTLPPVHNYPAGLPERVHIDQFGNKFRVARRQDPAAPGTWTPLPENACHDGHPHANGVACGVPVGLDGRHQGRHEREAANGSGVMHWPNNNEATVVTYLLGCKCQVPVRGEPDLGGPWYCAHHGDTTVTMAIPLGAQAS